ncbi:MAG: hypothetical protein NT085_05265 [candidate division SR1 bacterium]|nr:hypothetical protein [candidate division SR1 bacterium]
MDIINLSIEALQSPLFMIACVLSIVAFFLRNSWNLSWESVMVVTTIVWIIGELNELSKENIDMNEPEMVKWTVSLLGLLMCYFIPLGIAKAFIKNPDPKPAK